jgi:hypothetical protein
MIFHAEYGFDHGRIDKNSVGGRIIAGDMQEVVVGGHNASDDDQWVWDDEFRVQIDVPHKDGANVLHHDLAVTWASITDPEVSHIRSNMNTYWDENDNGNAIQYEANGYIPNPRYKEDVSYARTLQQVLLTYNDNWQYSLSDIEQWLKDNNRSDIYAVECNWEEVPFITPITDDGTELGDRIVEAVRGYWTDIEAGDAGLPEGRHDGDSTINTYSIHVYELPDTSDGLGDWMDNTTVGVLDPMYAIEEEDMLNPNGKKIGTTAPAAKSNLGWRTWNNMWRSNTSTWTSNEPGLQKASYEQRGPYANEIRFNKTDTCLRLLDPFWRGGGIYRGMD